MKSDLYLRVINDININRYNIEQICSKFYCDNTPELLEYLTQTFEESFEECLLLPNYINNYHCFLFNLTDAINDAEELEYLGVCLRKHISAIKHMIKPYNKKQKEKDEVLTKLTRLKNDLEGNYANAINKAINIYEDDNIKILKYIIFDLKDADALYHIIDNHREIVNIYHHEDEPLIVYIIRYFMQNITEMTTDDIDYYKRIITMILIRDELDLDESCVKELYDELDLLIGKEDNNKKDYKYIKYILDNHFILNKKDNTIFNEIITHKDLIEGRVDLRPLPTVTIDMVKYANNINMLYDDAFSISIGEDGSYYLYIHIPDVDEYIPRDQELNKYMKEMCESRYVKGDKSPMIPYRIARNISLIKGEPRRAITIHIHVDEEGNIINTNFFKSVICVDYNLSKNKADELIRDPNFPLNEMLNNMYKVGKLLRLNRGETIGKRSKGGIILDEFNIWANVSTAMYFDGNPELPFAFKNFLSDDYRSKHVGDIRRFLSENKVDEDSRNLLYDLAEAKSRTFYSLKNMGNAKFNGLPYSNVGNPLREYISLETDRLIKDLVINELNNFDYWYERIENDCIEQSEGASKVKELYKTNN